MALLILVLLSLFVLFAFLMLIVFVAPIASLVLSSEAWSRMAAAGALVAWWWFVRRARALGVDEAHAFNIAFWGLVGGILGAKLALVLVDWRTYLAQPALGHEGMTIGVRQLQQSRAQPIGWLLSLPFSSAAAGPYPINRGAGRERSGEGPGDRPDR